MENPLRCPSYTHLSRCFVFCCSTQVVCVYLEQQTWDCRQNIHLSEVLVTSPADLVWPSASSIALWSCSSSLETILNFLLIEEGHVAEFLLSIPQNGTTGLRQSFIVGLISFAWALTFSTQRDNIDSLSNSLTQPRLLYSSAITLTRKKSGGK